MANNRRRTLPQVSPKVAAELRPMVSAIKEIIETGEGVRGDPMDRKVTVRDLVDGGIIKVNIPVRSSGGLVVSPGDGSPDLSTPPIPSNFNAIGGFDGRIDLTWTVPGTLYSNHAYTNVYRAEEDNFANATLVGREAGSFYTDIVRDDATVKPYYYWISFTSVADVEGPLNSTAGTMAQALLDPDYIIDQITGRISESELAGELLTPIQSIPGMQSELNSQDQRIDLVVAGVDDNTSAIQTKAEVSAVQNLEDDITVLSAQYTVKLDVNGYVSGIGLSNDGTGSEFIVASDSVYFIDPSQSIETFNPGTNYTSIDDVRDTQLVFGYAEVEGHKRFVINVPAYIPEGYIQSGQVGAIGFGKITDSAGNPVTTVGGKLKADYIDADNLSVAEAATFFGNAQSGNYSAGSSGWRIQQSGSVEFQDGTFRGRIEADTGYISQNLQIGGTSQDIGGLLDLAQASDTSLFENWIRPSTTLIDGNKIFTGDAYVDTLQIQGQAVTFPRGSGAAASISAPFQSWSTVQSVTATLTGAPIVIHFSAVITTGSDSSNSGSIRMLNAGSLIYDEEEVVNGGSQIAPFAATIYIPNPGSGSRTFYFQIRRNAGADVFARKRYIAILEAKR